MIIVKIWMRTICTSPTKFLCVFVFPMNLEFGNCLEYLASCVGQHPLLGFTVRENTHDCACWQWTTFSASIQFSVRKVLFSQRFYHVTVFSSYKARSRNAPLTRVFEVRSIILLWIMKVKLKCQRYLVKCPCYCLYLCNIWCAMWLFLYRSMKCIPWYVGLALGRGLRV